MKDALVEGVPKRFAIVDHFGVNDDGLGVWVSDGGA